MLSVAQSLTPEFVVSTLPCRSQVPPTRDPVVLLHGWGCDSDCWQPLLAELQKRSEVICVDYLAALQVSVDLDEALELLLLQLPSRFVLMGWSLGGMLALRLADRAKDRVAAVITLASNLRFVANPQWPDAMAPEQYRQFLTLFTAAPEKTLQRFAGLMAKGDARERQLLKSLRGLAPTGLHSAGKSGLAHGLKLLGELDNRDLFSRLPVPGLHLLGEADALVPVAAQSAMSALAGDHQRVETLSGSCHALQWSQAREVIERLAGFIDSLPGHKAGMALDKRRVAASFGRAAASYDSVAGLQRQIGERLLRRIDAVSGADRWCLDLGCGTGHFIAGLQERGYMTLGLDLAEGMLEYASAHHDAHWLCADAERLPLADDAVDAIFSSLAIQWCHDLPALFGGLKRVVKPGGKLYLATLGPRTLHELRQSWQAVDGYVHVNRFIDAQSLQQALAAAGLTCRHWQQQDIVLHYDALGELTYELKTLGAHNVNSGQGSGLTGRDRIRRLRQAYEAFRLANGKLPATYEVFYMELEA